MAKTIISLILVILVIVFVLQNTQVVDVRLLVWKVSMSRALMVLVTFVVGVVAGWLVHKPKQKKGK